MSEDRSHGRADLPSLLSMYMVLAAWGPAALITLLHYATGHEHHWLHDVLRRLYYLPILFAAFSCGLRGGAVVALVVALAYSPHAFTNLIQIDPAHTLEKVLELLLYLVVGGVAGVLVDRLRRRQQELVTTTDQLRKALEEQRRTSDQLVRAGRLAALGEMVAGIAHEIKNPLHGLRGTAEVVDPLVPQDVPQRRMWELHLKELGRLEQVAQRFLSFARPSPLEKRRLDLVSTMEQARTLLEAQAREQSIKVSVSPAPPDLERTVQADEQQIIQVLLNIGLNALQVLGDGRGAIQFSLNAQTRGDERYTVVSVQNDGPAIPVEDLERIFDPFVTTKSDGVGLGLSIASRIVEQHGGFIEAHDLEGDRGVVFSVFLPAI